VWPEESFVVSAPATRALLCGCGGAETWLLLLLAVGGSLVPCLPCHQTLAHHEAAQVHNCSRLHHKP